jgi:hypothetical protein
MVAEKPTNLRYVIEKLIEVADMSEVAITDAIRAEGTEVTAATINRIKTGHIKRTSFDIGAALMRLYERHVQQKVA